MTVRETLKDQLEEIGWTLVDNKRFKRANFRIRWQQKQIETRPDVPRNEQEACKIMGFILEPPN